MVVVVGVDMAVVVMGMKLPMENFLQMCIEVKSIIHRVLPDQYGKLT